MCVVALAWQVHPDWPIILIGNRDEFHARAAAPLARWPDDMLGGRDLVAGGTWLGVDPNRSRVAVLTNVQGAAPDPERPSRGDLVRRALSTRADAMADIASEARRYNGFSLMAADLHDAALAGNRMVPPLRALSAGVHGVANQPFGAPCPRADAIVRALTERMAAARDDGPDPARLLDLLGPGGVPGLFLTGDVYGTRASSCVMIDAQGRGRFVERRYGPLARAEGEGCIAFAAPRA